jgi:hypothetical protein
MKILILSSKLFAILAIFGGTSYVALQRYTSVETIEITSTIGLIPTLFIGAVVLTAFLFVSNGLKQSLRESKFGTLSIMFFALTLGVILFGIWFVFNSMLISLQVSVDEYMLTMEYHKDTVFYMMIPIIAGVSVLGIVQILQFDLVQKLIKKIT